MNNIWSLQMVLYETVSLAFYWIRRFTDGLVCFIYLGSVYEKSITDRKQKRHIFAISVNHLGNNPFVGQKKMLYICIFWWPLYIIIVKKNEQE